MRPSSVIMPSPCRCETEISTFPSYSRGVSSHASPWPLSLAVGQRGRCFVLKLINTSQCEGSDQIDHLMRADFFEEIQFQISHTLFLYLVCSNAVWSCEHIYHSFLPATHCAFGRKKVPPFCLDALITCIRRARALLWFYLSSNAKIHRICYHFFPHWRHCGCLMFLPLIWL